MLASVRPISRYWLMSLASGRFELPASSFIDVPPAVCAGVLRSTTGIRKPQSEGWCNLDEIMLSWADGRAALLAGRRRAGLDRRSHPAAGGAADDALAAVGAGDRRAARRDDRRPGPLGLFRRGDRRRAAAAAGAAAAGDRLSV